MDRIYEPTPTGYLFHQARDIYTGFVRALLGPLGSGKSVSCVLELLMVSCEQEPDSEGVRRTKHAVVRNTYRELSDTTMATFFIWIPKDSGMFSVKDMSFTLVQDLDDGTVVEAMFLFRALDKPDDVKKLLSLDLTTVWINECREIPKSIVDGAQGRVGRYPSTGAQGVAPTFFGVIMDTNPPDADHWFYRLFEENLPDNHKLFHQPSGIAVNAENIPNLPPNYYRNMMAGKDKEWVNVYVHGQYGFVSDGKFIYNSYRDDIHYKDSSNPYVPNPLLPLYIGLDFGLTPAATIGQLTATGRLVIFDELVTFDMGAVNFGRLLYQKLSQTPYKQFLNRNNIEIYGDPAGEQRAQTDEQTIYAVLQAEGISAVPVFTNDFTIRLEAVMSFMRRFDANMEPAFAITPGAPTLRKACNGGYRYRRLQVTGEERYVDKPDKNRYSHVAEALQYLVLGAVGDSHVIGDMSSGKPLDYSYYDNLVR
jgi:hypothetical protein